MKGSHGGNVLNRGQHMFKPTDRFSEKSFEIRFCYWLMRWWWQFCRLIRMVDSMCMCRSLIDVLIRSKLENCWDTMEVAV